MQIGTGALLAGALGLALSAAGASGAMILDPGTYQLCNHPDGNSRPPGYGLILTGLYNVPGDSKDQFTFDFEHPDSKMSLTFDGEKITIQGEVYGGRDVGDHWANDGDLGVYEVFFCYNVATKAPGDDDLFVKDEGDSGWIKTVRGDTIDLFSKSNGQYTFRVGDEDDDNGHRGWNDSDDGFGVSGWGWLDFEGSKAPSDWLFTVKVPTPGSVALMLAAAPLAATRRRRSA